MPQTGLHTGRKIKISTRVFERSNCQRGKIDSFFVGCTWRRRGLGTCLTSGFSFVQAKSSLSSSLRKLATPKLSFYISLYHWGTQTTLACFDAKRSWSYSFVSRSQLIKLKTVKWSTHKICQRHLLWSWAHRGDYQFRWKVLIPVQNKAFGCFLWFFDRGSLRSLRSSKSSISKPFPACLRLPNCYCSAECIYAPETGLGRIGDNNLVLLSTECLLDKSNALSNRTRPSLRQLLATQPVCKLQSYPCWVRKISTLRSRIALSFPPPQCSSKLSVLFGRTHGTCSFFLVSSRHSPSCRSEAPYRNPFDTNTWFSQLHTELTRQKKFVIIRKHTKVANLKFWESLWNRIDICDSHGRCNNLLLNQMCGQYFCQLIWCTKRKKEKPNTHKSNQLCIKLQFFFSSTSSTIKRSPQLFQKLPNRPDHDKNPCASCLLPPAPDLLLQNCRATRFSLNYTACWGLKCFSSD